MIAMLQTFRDDIAMSFDFDKLNITPLLRYAAFMWPQRAAFYRHLATQCANDIPIEVALEKYKTRLLKRGRKQTAGVIDTVARRYENGRSLSSAMTGLVPVGELVVVASGEHSGRLPIILERLLESRENTAKITQILIMALIPPFTYLVALWMLLTLIGSQAVPSMAQTGSMAHLAGLGALVVMLADFSTGPFVILPPLATAGFVALFFWSLPRWTGPWRRRADRWFPWSYYRDIQGYVWLLTFTSMLSAGMADKEVLLEQAKYASPWLRERLTDTANLIENGKSFSDALVENGYEFPNPDLIDDIGSMAEFSDFSRRINKRGESWAKEMQFKSTARVTILSILFEFAILGFVTLVIQGITSISQAMGTF